MHLVRVWPPLGRHELGTGDSYRIRGTWNWSLLP